MKLGKFEIIPLTDGLLEADGGAVFGAVPKAIWSRLWEVSAENTIRLSMRGFLVKTAREWVLIDTGVGTKFSAEEDRQFGVIRTTCLLDELKKHSLSPTDISIVILTHLHFDHVGGATRRLESGEIVPTFPKARYIVNRTEWQIAQNPDVRSRSSYRPENYLPLRRQLEFVDRQAQIVMGVHTLQTGGHTKGHQSVLLESSGQKAILWADILPTTGHIKPIYPMGYDLYPLETMQIKEKLLSQSLRENWLSIFNHDPKKIFGYIVRQNERLDVRNVSEE